MQPTATVPDKRSFQQQHVLGEKKVINYNTVKKVENVKHAQGGNDSS